MELGILGIKVTLEFGDRTIEKKKKSLSEQVRENREKELEEPGVDIANRIWNIRNNTPPCKIQQDIELVGDKRSHFSYSIELGFSVWGLDIGDGMYLMMEGNGEFRTWAHYILYEGDEILIDFECGPTDLFSLDGIGKDNEELLSGNVVSINKYNAGLWEDRIRDRILSILDFPH